MKLVSWRGGAPSPAGASRPDRMTLGLAGRVSVEFYRHQFK